MDVRLPRHTRLTIPTDDVPNETGPRGTVRCRVNLVEHVQHLPAARPTGHVMEVQLEHTPNGGGVETGEHMVGNQGARPPGRQEVLLLRVGDMPCCAEVVVELMGRLR